MSKATSFWTIDVIPFRDTKSSTHWWAATLAGASKFEHSKKKSECLPIIHNQLHSVPWNLVPAFLPKRTNSRSNRAPPPQEVHGSTSARGAKVSCLERCRTSDVCRTNSLLQLCLNYTQNRIRLWILKTSRMNPHYFRNPHTNISSKTSSH